MLEHFGMQTSKPVSTPLTTHFKLSSALSPQTKEEREHMLHVPYTSVVESIMYVMACTRPYISHAASMVSRYMDHLGKIHWQVVKWILWYLRWTSHVDLVHDKSSVIYKEIVGYVDSKYVGDLDGRRSLTGYIFTLCGSVISWKTTL